MNFTTITDVVDEMLRQEPGFSNDLTNEELADIVRSTYHGRYEDMTEGHFAEILVAAYIACGADEATARSIVG
jgi:hypothetical protein